MILLDKLPLLGLNMEQYHGVIQFCVSRCCGAWRFYGSGQLGDISTVYILTYIGFSMNGFRKRLLRVRIFTTAKLFCALKEISVGAYLPSYGK
jgi:hypothetical protein